MSANGATLGETPPSISLSAAANDWRNSLKVSPPNSAARNRPSGASTRRICDQRARQVVDELKGERRDDEIERAVSETAAPPRRRQPAAGFLACRLRASAIGRPRSWRRFGRLPASACAQRVGRACRDRARDRTAAAPRPAVRRIRRRRDRAETSPARALPRARRRARTSARSKISGFGNVGLRHAGLSHFTARGVRPRRPAVTSSATTLASTMGDAASDPRRSRLAARLRRAAECRCAALWGACSILPLPPLCACLPRAARRHGRAVPGVLVASCRSSRRPYCERLGIPFAYDPGPGILSMEAIADPPAYRPRPRRGAFRRGRARSGACAQIRRPARPCRRSWAAGWRGPAAKSDRRSRRAGAGAAALAAVVGAAVQSGGGTRRRGRRGAAGCRCLPAR